MPFIHDDFLLNNEIAKILYHGYAEKMPIFDYHCHLSPKDIYEDKAFETITELWLSGDHYKWRVMRAAGILEEYITGHGSDYDKFFSYAKIMPQLIGNPLYHWTHMELKMYFGIDLLLNERTAETVYRMCNEKLRSKTFSVRNLIKRANVKYLSTTDDPVDDLKYHRLLSEDKTVDVVVTPAYRPDKAIDIEKAPFIDYIAKLGESVKRTVTDIDGVVTALVERMEYFHAHGARLSDHGLDYMPYLSTSKDEADAIFKKRLSGGTLSFTEVEKYKTYVLLNLARHYNRLHWVMQYHIGALRNNNTRMFKLLGPDSGYDSMNDDPAAHQLSQFLNNLNTSGELAKTIVYPLNPRDNYVIATMLGNFQDGYIMGKMQFGAAWWFNDQKTGMIEQMTTLANVGLLSRFVGMLTDSRSFLSYARHDYFRRILCNLIGEWAEKGEVPRDMELLGNLVKDISYNNAKNYFTK